MRIGLDWQYGATSHSFWDSVTWYFIFTFILLNSIAGTVITNFTIPTLGLTD